MPVEIERLSLDDDVPPKAGTVIVREVGPGHSEVLFVMKGGPWRGTVVYSSYLGRGDDFEQAIEWAVNWSAGRGIWKVYIEQELAAGQGGASVASAGVIDG